MPLFIHPPSLVDKFNNIKIVFLPKNTTSRLQPLDAGIIQSFKYKYRKKLMRFVIARPKDDVLASEITKQVDVLQAIEWIAKAWGEVSVDTIKNCFKKCGFDENSNKMMLMTMKKFWMKSLKPCLTNLLIHQ